MSGALSGGAAIVLDAIIRAAKAGKACPTNPELAALMGASSVSSPVNAMAKLEKAGSIVVERFSSGRDVRIPSLGIATAPYGGARSSHWRLSPNRPATTRQATPRLPANSGLKNPEILPVRVERDPCFWCGVRADIGCEHHAATSRAAA